MVGRTVDDLIAEVRSMIDEANIADITDNADILPAMNRGMDHAVSLLAMNYPSPLLAYQTVTPVSGQNEYDVPEDALEQRLVKVEAQYGSSFEELQQVDYQDISKHEYTTGNSSSLVYTIVGDKYRVLPGATPSKPLRIWYVKEPPKLVKAQGRINILNIASNYVIVDVVGTDLNTESDSLNSYANIVDGATGKIKATLQIQNINSTKVTFKTVISPTRTTVLGYPVSIAIPTTVTQDDYICLATGSCIPFMKRPLSNFLVQYTVAEIRRKLGIDAAFEEQALSKFEKQVKNMSVGQDFGTRIQSKNPLWNNVRLRRYPITD